MHFVKDIFQNKHTEHAHNKFIRYSKGKFVGPLLKIKLSKSQVKLNASFHYNDELLDLVGKYLGNKEVHVKGSLIWNCDLSEKLLSHGIKYSKVSKARGIFKYVLDNDIKVKDFVGSMSSYNLILTIKTDDLSIVTKPNFPKPNKEFSSDFCKVILPESLRDVVLKDFAFDVKEKKVKQIVIRHEIDVSDIDVPKVDNFEEARKLAKRVGVMRRYVTIDNGDETMTEISFKE